MRPSIILSSASFVFLCALSLACAARPPLAARDESAAANGGPNFGILFSPQGGRIAYSVVRGRRELVVTREADGRTHEDAAYESVRSLAFSPDGTALAYIGVRGGRAHVVRNGAEGKGYRATLDSAPVFSREGGHVAYLAERDDGTYAVVRDGEEQPFNASPSTTPVFSPDGRHLAFYASEPNAKDPTQGRAFLVVDGKPGKRYLSRNVVGRPAYKRDEGEFVYIGGDDAHRFVVVGPREGAPYKNVYFPAMSRDGATLAYAAELDGGGSAVVVERRGKSEQFGPYPCCVFDTQLKLDPEGKRIAFLARGERGGYRLNLDGRWLGRGYEQAGELVMSPPGAPERVAFVATERVPVSPRFPDGLRASVVVTRAGAGELEESPRYAQVSDLRFDGQGRLLYVAQENGRARVVLDGEAGPEARAISALGTSLDGRAVAYVADVGPDQARVYQRAASSKAPTPWSAGPPFEHVAPKLEFDADGLAIYAGTRGGRSSWVRGVRESSPYDEIHELRLSPDKKSILAVVSEGRHLAILLNGTAIAHEDGVGVLGTPELYRQGAHTYPVAAGQVTTFSSRGAYYLQLNDRTLYTFDDLTGGGPSVAFRGRVAGADVFVLSVYQGDGCPARNGVISIPPRGQSFVSELIGNCDDARIRRAGKRLVLSYPRSAPNRPAERWALEAGKLKRLD